MTTGFGSDLQVNPLTFKAASGAALSDRMLDDIQEGFNAFGFVIMEFEPRSEPKEDLLALSPFFGRVVRHNRSDRYGILAVNADKPVEGFIDSSNEAHPPHTDGAFKDAPEKVVALQCVLPAKVGGTSLLGSGKLAHDALADRHPRDLIELYDTDAISIQRNEQSSTKPIFRREDDLVTMCFRMDQTAKTAVKPSAQKGFQRLKEALDQNLFRFDLKPHQILIIDNLSLVHGRDAFPQGTSRHYNRLNFDGDGLLDLECGFRSDHDLPESAPLTSSLGAGTPVPSVFEGANRSGS